MKKTTLFTIVLAISLFATLIITYAVERESDIARQVLRLHVVANSNNDYDQALKYAIRDRIVEETRELFADSNCVEVSKQLATENLDLLLSIAQEEIKNHGFNYNVSISLGTQAFPATVYGNIMFPVGVYDALIITIGNAVGENWWCVIFPPLCFIDGINMESADNNEIQIRFRIFDALSGNS